MDDLVKKEMRFQGAREVIEDEHKAEPDLAPGLKL